MPKIVPTVGRMVICHGVSKAGPVPGTIVHAWGSTPESCVNVHVFGDGANEPMYQAMLSVQVFNPDEVPDPAPEKYCTWMPFQVGQAAKTEQLQAKLDGGDVICGGGNEGIGGING